MDYVRIWYCGVIRRADRSRQQNILLHHHTMNAYSFPRPYRILLKEDTSPEMRRGIARLEIDLFPNRVWGIKNKATWVITGANLATRVVTDQIAIYHNLTGGENAYRFSIRSRHQTLGGTLPGPAQVYYPVFVL